jgi:hypothetical protein
VSLQAFAPDVCNETAYVINRMMAKNPDKRYGSYNELVEHLRFALQKARERESHPGETRKVLVVEEKSGPVWLTLLVPALIILGILGMAALYFFTDVFKNLPE